MAETGQSFKADKLRLTMLALRSLVAMFSVIAVIVMVLDRETSSVPIFLGLSQPLYVEVTAKFKMIEGLRFFVGAMVAVAVYSFLHILLEVAKKKASSYGIAMAWISYIGDSAIAYMIVSAISVACEIAYLAERGAAQVLWKQVCNHFNRFCTVYGVSIASAAVCAFASFAVVTVSSYHLFHLYHTERIEYSIKS